MPWCTLSVYFHHFILTTNVNFLFQINRFQIAFVSFRLYIRLCIISVCKFTIHQQEKRKIYKNWLGLFEGSYDCINTNVLQSNNKNANEYKSSFPKPFQLSSSSGHRLYKNDNDKILNQTHITLSRSLYTSKMNDLQ